MISIIRLQELFSMKMAALSKTQWEMLGSLWPTKGKNFKINLGGKLRFSSQVSKLSSLITLQTLSVNRESLYYFQVSPTVSHCDKVPASLTQWWITPDIEFSDGCRESLVDCSPEMPQTNTGCSAHEQSWDLGKIKQMHFREKRCVINNCCLYFYCVFMLQLIKMPIKQILTFQILSCLYSAEMTGLRVHWEI